MNIEKPHILHIGPAHKIPTLFVHLILFIGINCGIQYTNAQSEAVQITVFFWVGGGGMLSYIYKINV